jgi:hypothetical protein
MQLLRRYYGAITALVDRGARVVVQQLVAALLQLVAALLQLVAALLQLVAASCS